MAEQPSAQARSCDEPPSLRHALGQWGEDVRLMADALSELAASEARLAAYSLAMMLAAALVLAIMAAALWTTLASAIALAVFDGDEVWLATSLSVAAASALAGGVCYLMIRHLSRNLGFPGMRAVLFRPPGRRITAEDVDREGVRP
ncbi:MAG: hypothetical protein H6953_12995 [Chromatiaceae bacterium]|nr:hypothetical protein [Gammaproteobacteria bacterium]MCP5306351.1 hypothetical protein [Chromatiaceae bacterium]MCP5311903.1 hypothetical protein [Chromatiaceae bacterium]